MTQTYTTQWFSVSNGDITTHNPQELAGGGDEITVSNAEIQWKGINGSDTDFESSERNNDTGFVNVSDEKTISLDILSPDFNEDIESSFAVQGAKELATPDVTIDWTVDAPWGDFSGTNTFTSSGLGPDDVFVEDTVSGNYSGDDVSITVTVTSGQTAVIKLFTTIESESTSSTTTYTTSPRVTRDVSADSNSGTLNDGETTNWTSLSGLEASGNQEFYHDINGSGEARFRFRFDWEYTFPTALKQLRVKDTNDNTTHKVSLADPSDSQLDYNSFRTAIDGTTYAIDVVDPSDPSAIKTHRMYHPVDGIVCPRSYDTV